MEMPKRRGHEEVATAIESYGRLRRGAERGSGKRLERGRVQLGLRNAPPAAPQGAGPPAPSDWVGASRPER